MTVAYIPCPQKHNHHSPAGVPLYEEQGEWGSTNAGLEGGIAKYG